MDYTRDFAKYLAGLKYKDLPVEVVEKTKLLILDYLAVSLAAVEERSAKLCLDLVNIFGGKPESTILGFGKKNSCANAAFVNGCLGGVLELNDTHAVTMSHPGQSLIAAALALAEKEKASGKDLITAAVAGYDAALRIGKAVSPSHYAKWGCPMGTTNNFGSAAAAGKILKLNSDQMDNVFSFAGHQAGQLPRDTLGKVEPRQHKEKQDTGPFYFAGGKAAMHGVISALLCQLGANAPKQAIARYAKNFSESVKLQEVIKDLGRHYSVMEVAIKQWSMCRYLHGAVEATLEIIRNNKVSSDDVTEIVVRSYSYIMEFYDPAPFSSLSARFSTPFQIALALVEGEAGLNKVLQDPTNYPAKKLKDTAIKKLMRRVKFEYDPSLDQKWPRTWLNIVTIKTKNGQSYTESVELPKGEPENPMTKDDVFKKVRLTATRVIGKNKVEKLIKLVDNLEEVKDISEIITNANPPS